jgi:hypothetical protein
MKWALCAVAAVSLLMLGVRAGRVGLAGDDLDPVGRVSGQDEAIYAHSAIRMARHGGWLTPMFLDRYSLYKPPLLMWSAGLAARVFGVSRQSLRAPVVLASAGAVLLVFLWVASLRGVAAGLAAALLVLSNRLWQILGAMCLTDGLLAALTVAAVFILARDPALERRRSLWLFAASVAGGVLVKSVAGFLPLLILGVYFLLAPAGARPAWRRALRAAVLGAALAAPWFVYQILVHPRWFWVEHIGLELVAYGARTPPQTSSDSHVSFYAGRLWLTDPALVLLALAALPGLIAALRRRTPADAVLLAWIAVAGGAVFGWRYRNLSYLMPLVPALAIVAAGYGPLFRGRAARYGLLLVCLIVPWKMASAERTWGLPYRGGTRLALAPALSGYCARGRANDLVILGMDDSFYATVLPLPRIHYALVGVPPPPPDYEMDFVAMGIMLDAAQFADLARAEEAALPKLRAWGLDSRRAVGTVVLAKSPDEVAMMLNSQPAMDWLLPEDLHSRLSPTAGATHEEVPAGAGHFFLLSRQGRPRAREPKAWCEL